MAEIPERWKDDHEKVQLSELHDWAEQLQSCIEELGTAEARIRELEKALQWYRKHVGTDSFTGELFVQHEPKALAELENILFHKVGFVGKSDL